MNPLDFKPRSLVLSLVVVLSTLLGAAQARSVPGDGALPVVQLMPLVMKHEADLNLTGAQLDALAAYRKTAMPARIAVQNRILELRGRLRVALLDNGPQAERDALMQQIAAAEIEHFKGRERCVENLRQVLDAGQYAKLRQFYLADLR